MKSVNYFRLGLFVLSGFGLLIIIILVLSSSNLFHRPKVFETYFNESVEGLTAGSNVKFRGVTVGTIEKISFVNLIYPQEYPHYLSNVDHSRYIYVKMALDLPFLTGLNDKQIKTYLNKAINSGLRIRLTPQGLTGAAVLEINYFPPASNPKLPFSWVPQDYYIPSTQSTFTELTALLGELHKANFPKLFENFNAVLNKTNELLDKSQFGDVGKKMQSTMDSIQQTAISINMLTRKINQAVQSQQLERTLKNIDNAAIELDALLNRAPKTLDLLNKTLYNANIMIMSNQHSVQESITNLQTATGYFRQFSQNISSDPAQLLLSKPPQSIEQAQMQAVHER